MCKHVWLKDSMNLGSREQCGTCFEIRWIKNKTSNLSLPVKESVSQ